MRRTRRTKRVAACQWMMWRMTQTAMGDLGMEWLGSYWEMFYTVSTNDGELKSWQ